MWSTGSGSARWTRAVVVLVLVVGAIASFELAMRRVKTSYSKKRAMLEARAPEIEVLVTGASGALFGIDPSKLGPNAVNLAEMSQSLYYDRQIVERYVDRLPRLRLVLLPVGTVTLETSAHVGGELWRSRLYTRYWDFVPPDPEPALDVRRFSVAALFPPAIRMKALLTFDLAAQLDANGFEPAPPGVVTQASAEQEYAAHRALFDAANLEENAGELRRILGLLGRRGVRAVLVMPPVSRFYSGLVEPEVRARDLALLHALTEEFDVRLSDYTDDPRFDDAAFRDADHLNAAGAARFSTILAEELVEVL